MFPATTQLKQVIANFSYRIEPKPEGGFIARSSDASLPMLEASTREELQDKIQARINDEILAAFPGLNLSVENKDLKFAFHIEPKPGGGYIAQSVGPDSKPIEGSTHEEVQQRLAEKLVGALGKYLLPQLPEAFGNPNSKDVKVFLNIRSAGPQFKTSAMQNTGIANAGDNSPIQPGADSSWTVFRMLLIALTIVFLMYFFFRH